MVSYSSRLKSLELGCCAFFRAKSCCSRRIIRLSSVIGVESSSELSCSLFAGRAVVGTVAIADEHWSALELATEVIQLLLVGGSPEPDSRRCATVQLAVDPFGVLVVDELPGVEEVVCPSIAKTLQKFVSSWLRDPEFVLLELIQCNYIIL